MQLLTALESQCGALRARVDKDARRAGKLQGRVRLLTQGYAQRRERLLAGACDKHAELRALQHDTGAVAM